MSNSLSNIVTRFTGSSFVLYGGNEDLLRELSTVGNVLVWFREEADATTVPPRQSYDKLFDTIFDAIYVIVTNGNMGRQKVETSIMRILRGISTGHRIVILHGYTSFIETGLSVVTESYDGGVVVSLADDRVNTLKQLNSALSTDNRSLPSIPVPLIEISSIPNIDFMLPYIHISSRIKDLEGKIPITDDLPVAIMDTSDPTKQRDYNPEEFTNARNWGQRKLLISEIELMTKVYESLPEDDRFGVIFIYIGSAPGSHIERLVDMFAIYGPEFHLWDRISGTEGRNNFDINVEAYADSIKIVPREYIPNTYEQELDPFIPDNVRDKPYDEQINSVYGFFTNGVMKMYMEKHPGNNRLVFISDIRDRASEEAVMRDMELQRYWVENINPLASQLKFRLPFLQENNYEYLDGDIYTQAWSRNKSTEARLLSFRPFKTKMYNVRDYDRSMSYFNVVTRVNSYDMGAIVESITKDRHNIGRYIHVPEDGLCTCHDCAREVQVITSYLHLYGYPIGEEEIRAEVQANTRYSRPARLRNVHPRTLWTQVSIKTPPFDRKHLILYKDTSIDREAIRDQLNQLWRVEMEARDTITERDEIHVRTDRIQDILVTSYNTVMVYADGYSPEEIISLLLRKETGTTLMLCPPDSPTDCDTSNNQLRLMQQILQGQDFTVLVNFHTDFVKEYDPKRDLGSLGNARYNQLLQNMALAEQTGNTKSLSSWQHLALFVLRRAKLLRRRFVEE